MEVFSWNFRDNENVRQYTSWNILDCQGRLDCFTVPKLGGTMPASNIAENVYMQLNIYI